MRREGAGRRIIAVAVDVGDGEGDAVLAAAPMFGEQPGIAVQFLRGRIFVGVGEAEGRGGEAVELEARIGVIAAQVRSEARRELDAQPAAGIILAIAVRLGAHGRLRNAVGAEIAAGQRALHRVVARGDRGVGGDLVGIAIFGIGARLDPVDGLLGDDIDHAAESPGCPRSPNWARAGSSTRWTAPVSRLPKSNAPAGAEGSLARTPSISTRVCSSSAPRMRTAVTPPGPPLRVEETPGRGGEQVGERDGLARLDQVAVEHGDRAAGGLGLLLDARGDDDDPVVVRLGMRHGRQQCGGGVKKQLQLGHGKDTFVWGRLAENRRGDPVKRCRSREGTPSFARCTPPAQRNRL